MNFYENIEIKEAIKVFAIAGYDEDKLGFKVNLQTGELLDEIGSPIASKKIGSELIKKANAAGIKYIFVGDTNHTEIEKDKLFLEKGFFKFSKLLEN